ncbi:TPA: dATP/dGTP pyrophosphohydrolase domain-containing protein [Klebsiella pneumoniae]
MTNNQLTDAQISNATLIRLIRWADEHKSHYVAAALRELQERRKADREPVALQPELAKVIYHFRDWNEGFPVERFKADYVISWMLENYPPAQPAKDRDQVRREHAEWSQATFGNVGPVGPLKHLSKEALEAAAEPGDLSEWADMQFLMWDAQRRAGITDGQIAQAMIEKLAVNKQREWPEPKDGEPRLHIKEQPAPVVPVVPDFKKLARELVDNLVDCGGLDEGVKEKYLEWAEKTCHAAMFAAAPQENN